MIFCKNFRFPFIPFTHHHHQMILKITENVYLKSTNYKAKYEAKI